MTEPEEEWVEVRRYDDPIRAEMTRNFLVEHGVRVGMRGHPGVTAVLNRFTTVVDIRLDVPRSEVEAARETLAALEESDVVEQPFRGMRPRDPESTSDGDPPRSGVVVLAWAFGIVVAALALLLATS